MKVCLYGTVFLLLCSSVYGQSQTDIYQSLRGVKTGTPLRVEADSIGSICARLDRVSTASDSIYLIPDTALPYAPLDHQPVLDFRGKPLEYQPLQTPVSINVSEISRVYKPGNRGGLGILIGAVGGALIGLVSFDDGKGGFFDENKGNTADLFYYTLSGAAAGGIIGLLFPSWKQVYSRD